MSTLLHAIAAALSAAGGHLVEREIDVRGQPVKVYLQEPSGDEMEQVYASVRDAEGQVPPERNRELGQRIMAATVRNADGSPAMTHEEAGALPTSVHAQLQKHVLALTGLAKKGEGEKNG